MEICNDVINEILSHCSSETLATCRLLSKDIASVTYLSNFVSLRNQRSNTISGYFVQELQSKRYQSSFVSPFPTTRKPSLDFLPDKDVKIAASTEQGILLCSNEWHSPRCCYYVCKPCTEEWVKIPNPKTKNRTESFGMVVMKLNPLRFKIVRFSHAKSRFFKGRIDRGLLMWCEVFDSDTWRWRKFDDEVFMYQSDETLCYQPAVSACGSLHWLTTASNIVTFDVLNEYYDIYSPPDVDDANSGGRSKLLKYEGKLGFTYTTEEDGYGSVQLWVLDNYNRGLWKKRKVAMLGDASNIQTEPHYGIIAFYGSDMAVMDGFCKLLHYNLESKKVEGVTMHTCRGAKDEDIFPFQSDYEKCNLGGGRDDLFEEKPKKLHKAQES